MPLRALPSVDQLLKTDKVEVLKRSVGIGRVTAIARRVTQELRAELLAGSTPLQSGATRESLLAEAIRRLDAMCRLDELSGVRRVINATGVILHTNLGRAPLSKGAQEAVAQEATGYCTIEFDLVSGARGRRGGRVEQLLQELIGAEDALVVNNCASAALLILLELATNGEVVVSRGELVEIGGDFRVPDIMSISGARMIEVGTTNRTRLDDYRHALTQRTRLLMRVHQSNYRIIGFTSAPSLNELVSLAHEVGVPFYLDAGSGALNDLTDVGLTDEPIIKDCIAAGVDVVSFSGDKLLGGPQSGIIVGKASTIHRLRRHPLYRALRADKLCLAALEATLLSYARDAERSEIPVLQMLTMEKEQIESRASEFIMRLDSEKPELSVKLVSGESAVGGGSGPNVCPPSALIAISHAFLSPTELEGQLRLSNPPIIARIKDGQVLLDLRTVSAEEENELFRGLIELALLG